MTIRQQHAALTRRTLLTAARRLFAERGFASTAVRPIAAAAGVSVQTLYSTFGSKQGLLIALVDVIREETGAPTLWEHLLLAEDPAEVVRRAAHLRRRILEQCGDIVITMREGCAADPDVAAAYAEGQARNRQGITRMCTRLRELGVPLDGRAVDRVAASFSAEAYEELVGPRSGWTPEEYEQWLAQVLTWTLLPAARGRSGG